MAQVFQGFRPLAWFMLVLVVFLIGADIVIIQTTRQTRLNQAYQSIQDELSLISLLARDHLLRRSYASLEQTLLDWAAENSLIVEIKTDLPNGFALVHYDRKDKPANVYRVSRDIIFHEKKLAVVELTKDLSPLMAEIGSFTIHLILASILFCTTLGFILWNTFRKTAIIPLARMIDSSRQSELATRAAYAELNQIFDTAADGMRIIDRDFNVLRINETFSRMAHISKEDAIGKKCHAMFRGPSCDTSGCSLQRILAGEQRIEEETEKIAADGTGIPCIVTATPYVRSDGLTVGVIENFKDISERKQAERDKEEIQQQLYKSQKLESIGTLAGGIAHDFNNILAAINLNIFMVKDSPGLSENATQRLEAIDISLGRAADLAKQLLTFSKGGTPIKVMAAIAELIRESATFALRGSGVNCVFKISADLLLAEIDKGQISQTINNLIINAKEAMPEGGTITITAENETIGPQDARPLSPGAYVVIAVADTGTGISEEQLSKIFDPYFTTKQHGSGLGLSIVFSIVKKHQGYIDVESKPGVGTTFRIYLPASVQTISAGPETSKPTIRGKGKILIMDDDVMISAALSEVLRDLGYDVELSQDGNKAIATYRKALESKQPFDVVILDLTIPGGMGGKEAMKMLLTIDPQIKAIVSSGYSTDAVMADYQEYGFSGVLDKPYDFSKLTDILQTLIQASA